MVLLDYLVNASSVRVDCIFGHSIVNGVASHDFFPQYTAILGIKGASIPRLHITFTVGSNLYKQTNPLTQILINALEIKRQLHCHYFDKRQVFKPPSSACYVFYFTFTTSTIFENNVF